MNKTRLTLPLLSRRAFLKYHSVAAAAALSPFIPVLNSQAQEANIPKRIIFFNTFNGTIVDEFFPDQTGRDFQLKRVLEPMQAFRDRMTILGNVDIIPAPGGAHTSMGMLLTNEIPNDERLGQGVSVDQVIASQIGVDTPFSSVHLGNVTQGGGAASVFYRGPSDAIAAEDNAYRSFDRLFSRSVDNIAAQRLALRRTSIIDSVREDLNAFRATLPQDDQHLVDLHLDSIRTLENELASNVICAPPELQQGTDTGAISNMPVTSRLNNQVAVAALSCGLTRVIGMPFLRPVRDHALTFLGQTEGLHTISHNGVPDSREKYITIQRWYSEQLADLCARLASVPEGSGSMLDNTLVVWSNPLSDGSRHSKSNLPILMIGGQWYFDVGQYHQYSSEPHGKWLVSLCHAMGVNVSTFGRTETSQGPLGSIVV